MDRRRVRPLARKARNNAVDAILDVGSPDEDGKDLEASLACEVMPAITLPDLGKVIVDRPKVDSDPKEVEETLERIADENRPTAPIAKARAATLGDVAMIAFIGRIDGEAFTSSSQLRGGERCGGGCGWSRGQICRPFFTM